MGLPLSCTQGVRVCRGRCPSTPPAQDPTGTMSTPTSPQPTTQTCRCRPVHRDLGEGFQPGRPRDRPTTTHYTGQGPRPGRSPRTRGPVTPSGPRYSRRARVLSGPTRGVHLGFGKMLRTHVLSTRTLCPPLTLTKTRRHRRMRVLTWFLPRTHKTSCGLDTAFSDGLDVSPGPAPDPPRHNARPHCEEQVGPLPTRSGWERG